MRAETAPAPAGSRTGGADGLVQTREELADLCRRVLAAVRRACPSWLADHEDDIVQNVLVQLLRQLRSAETKTAFSSMYLTKAAYGATVDEIRRVARRRERGMNEPEALERLPARGVDPERHTRSYELQAGIRDCLTRLLRPRRAAVTLYLQGCTVDEVAWRRRWPHKRAHNLVYRGLANLRACLEVKGLAP